MGWPPSTGELAASTVGANPRPPGPSLQTLSWPTCGSRTMRKVYHFDCKSPASAVKLIRTQAENKEKKLHRPRGKLQKRRRSQDVPRSPSLGTDSQAARAHGPPGRHTQRDSRAGYQDRGLEHAVHLSPDSHRLATPRRSVKPRRKPPRPSGGVSRRRHPCGRVHFLGSADSSGRLPSLNLPPPHAIIQGRRLGSMPFAAQ